MILGIESPMQAAATHALSLLFACWVLSRGRGDTATTAALAPSQIRKAGPRLLCLKQASHHTARGPWSTPPRKQFPFASMVGTGGGRAWRRHSRHRSCSVAEAGTGARCRSSSSVVLDGVQRIFLQTEK
jgi:hypothetical protein